MIYKNSAVLSALGMLLLSAAVIGAESSPDWYYVGYQGKEFASGQQPSIPINADSPLAKSPLSGILTQCRDRPLHYRFTLAAGTYHVKLHYLQAGAGPSKNNADIAVSINGAAIKAERMWMPSTSARGGKDKEIPADITAKVLEADVVAADGRIRIDFPHSMERRDWGVSGIELVGPQTVRVRCGSAEPYTDPQGNQWEPDGAHYRPIPPDGEFTIKEADRSKNVWVNISKEFFSRMGEATGLAPLPRPFFAWRVLCDHEGRVFILVGGMGCWRYDWAGGKVWRVDGGHYSAMPTAESINPAGPGMCMMGILGITKDGYAVSTDDGEKFTPIYGHNGMEHISVDWSANPHVVYAWLHDRNGQTCVSVDGGKTFKDFNDTGNKNIGGIGAIGTGVLLKCQLDGTLLRSPDLGITWEKPIELKFTTPGECFIQRLGDTVFLHNGSGELFISKDLGVTWTSGPKTPGFSLPVVRGKGEQQLIGFNPMEAYESLDFGQTWTKVIGFKPGKRWDGFSPWCYDRVLDAFYYVKSNGEIIRYAR